MIINRLIYLYRILSHAIYFLLLLLLIGKVQKFNWPGQFPQSTSLQSSSDNQRICWKHLTDQGTEFVNQAIFFKRNNEQRICNFQQNDNLVLSHLHGKSNFQSFLCDKTKGEFGIAGWTSSNLLFDYTVMQGLFLKTSQQKWMKAFMTTDIQNQEIFQSVPRVIRRVLDWGLMKTILFSLNQTIPDSTNRELRFGLEYRNCLSEGDSKIVNDDECKTVKRLCGKWVSYIDCMRLFLNEKGSCDKAKLTQDLVETSMCQVNLDEERETLLIGDSYPQTTAQNGTNNSTDAYWISQSVVSEIGGENEVGGNENPDNPKSNPISSQDIAPMKSEPGFVKENSKF